MDPMHLHGRALLDHFEGDRDATILLHRDDGYGYPPLPARHWFYEEGLPDLDRSALSLCRGRTLDVGAAAGSHSLALQRRGLEVIALERSAPAVAVMTRRGVRHPLHGSIFEPLSVSVDTVLLLCNIGIVQDLEGLSRFFQHLKSFLSPGGRLITDSVDPRNDEDPVYAAYRRHKVASGRYEGERTLRFEYRGQVSPWFEWMHVAFEPLAERAAQAGFSCSPRALDVRRFLCLLEWSGG